jgi:hypothetical protein
MLAWREVSKFLINTINLRELPGPYLRQVGHCWVVPLLKLASKANQFLLNHVAVRHRSPLVIYEDGVPLGPAHSPQSSICFEGGGRFTHWYDDLLFSTSDNTDPNTNGRSYTYSLSPWLFERRASTRARACMARDSHAPLQGPTERNGDDVNSAIRLARQVLQMVRTGISSLSGRTILEVGPGSSYGASMVLACYGMQPVVTDSFLIPWNDDYHGWYYRALAEALVRIDPEVDVRPLRALIEAGNHDAGPLGRVAWRSGELRLPSDGIDVVFSNGVIEHLEALDAVAKELFRITRPGGLHWHQVQCHDHRDRQRPLEYLLLEETEFQDLFRRCRQECGNRWRPTEITAQFEAAQFDVLGFDADTLTRLKYVEDLLPRLRGARRSRYCDLHANDLRIIVGICRSRKPA